MSKRSNNDIDWGVMGDFEIGDVNDDEILGMIECLKIGYASVVFYHGRYMDLLSGIEDKVMSGGKLDRVDEDKVFNLYSRYLKEVSLSLKLLDDILVHKSSYKIYQNKLSCLKKIFSIFKKELSFD